MTTIFESIQPSQAQTHFLIIGVGAYRHLLGGSGPTLDNSMDLKQLSSPPISAKTITDWVFKEFRNPVAPLGSVELLLSPAEDYTSPTDNSRQSVDAATFSNIQQAFDRWYQRCNLHRGNVAIFYFCGHGVMKENLALLAEDFGENPNRLFQNSINFDLTHRGMAACKAETQCYFIDSCRKIPREVLNLYEVNATPLLDARLRDLQPHADLILYASSRNESAYGALNEPTRFTNALLQGLRGLGAKRTNGQWVITAARLSEAVVDVVERENDDPRYTQHCRPEGASTSVIHVLRESPPVLITIGVSPTAAQSYAELSFFQGSRLHSNRVPSSGLWKFTVSASADYEAQARFPNGEYRDPDVKQIWAYPPSVDEFFEVEAAL